MTRRGLSVLLITIASWALIVAAGYALANLIGLLALLRVAGAA